MDGKVTFDAMDNTDARPNYFTKMGREEGAIQRTTLVSSVCCSRDGGLVSGVSLASSGCSALDGCDFYAMDVTNIGSRAKARTSRLEKLLFRLETGRASVADRSDSTAICCFKDGRIPSRV